MNSLSYGSFFLGKRRVLHRALFIIHYNQARLSISCLITVDN